MVFEIEPVNALILMFLRKGREWARETNDDEIGKRGSGSGEEEMEERLE